MVLLAAVAGNYKFGVWNPLLQQRERVEDGIDILLQAEPAGVDDCGAMEAQLRLELALRA